MLPTARRHGMAVIPWSPLAGGWLSGRWRKGADTPESPRAALVPRRYDLSLPENQRKLEVADALARLADEAGLSLIHMALAFVIRHPAVTSAIIGPRTMEHLESQLGAADVVLDDELLDRIDEIVPPGINLNPADAGWTNPDLAPTAGADSAAEQAEQLAPVARVGLLVVDLEIGHREPVASALVELRAVRHAGERRLEPLHLLRRHRAVLVGVRDVDLGPDVAGHAVRALRRIGGQVAAVEAGGRRHALR